MEKFAEDPLRSRRRTLRDQETQTFTEPIFDSRTQQEASLTPIIDVHFSCSLRYCWGVAKRSCRSLNRDLQHGSKARHLEALKVKHYTLSSTFSSRPPILENPNERSLLQTPAWAASQIVSDV